MVPTAIVTQAKAVGLDMISVCDHNSTENTAAVMHAGRRESLCVIPGIEITTCEEVHVLGLFETELDLAGIRTVVDDHLPGTNEEAAFGPQTIVDSWDRPIGSSARLLAGASTLSVEQVVEAIHGFGGLAIAAHVDRPSFGLIGHLGFIPAGLRLDAVEISARSLVRQYDPYPVVTSSDAHSLRDIGRSCTSLWGEHASFQELAKALRREGSRRVSLEMEDLSLHVLDIVENALSASADRVRILIHEDTGTDQMLLEIEDNGRGMDAELCQRALDPFFTTKTTRRVGLGLPLLAQAARESGGVLELISEPGRGTTVRAVFRLSHPDRKPLGDIAETLRTVLGSRPDVGLRFDYTRDSDIIATLDTGGP
jgi:3',5'-nucleoside bisphosphate phosphatase